MSDTELYLLIKERSKSGFEYMYSRYSCILYGLAVKAVKSKEYAEEIVEQTFTKIWKSIDLFINQNASMNVWIIQKLIMTIQEYLTSKSITYTLKTNHFPAFSFELAEEDIDYYKSPDIITLNLNVI
ncbi:sigma factor [Chryseobacterium sp. KACC 21268]|nr:sigma factor [Chryseobacterium sp. KACC 21268]